MRAPFLDLSTAYCKVGAISVRLIDEMLIRSLNPLNSEDKTICSRKATT